MMNLYRSLQTGWHRVPERYRSRLGAVPLVHHGMSWMRGRYATHDEIYDQSYFAGVDRHAKTSAPAIAESIVREFSPDRVIDVGCGSGALLAELQSRGVSADGVEYSQAALAYCRVRGLTVWRVDLEQAMPADLIRGHDVVVSMEVAEHLPARVADCFVEALCGASRAVVFTAAVPGQGGSDHVNEQPNEYWIDRFRRHGFDHDRERSERWRAQWKERGVTWFYRQNLMIFTRRRTA